MIISFSLLSPFKSFNFVHRILNPIKAWSSLKIYRPFSKRLQYHLFCHTYFSTAYIKSKNRRQTPSVSASVTLYLSFFIYSIFVLLWCHPHDF
jgi:hypothetical protein